MNDPDHKLPLLQSVNWAFQWAAAVALRHRSVVALYVAGGAVVGLLGGLASSLAGLVFLLYLLATVPLALLCHGEVLRGPSRLDAATLGQGWGRMLGYVVDTVLIGIAAILAALVPVLLIGLLLAGGAPLTLRTGLDIVFTLVIIVVVLVVASRPALRLPSRVLGDPIPWKQAWQLGHGNTLQLILGPVLVSLPLAFVQTLAGWLLPAMLTDLIDGALMPIQTILVCAFLSVAFGQLSRINAKP